MKTIFSLVVIAVIGALILIQYPISSAVAFLAGIVLSYVTISISHKTLGNRSQDQLSTTTLYVGNLPYKANEAQVKSIFSEYGEVFAVRLMKDKKTGKRRGFGFVVMSQTDTPKAIENLNEFNYMDRTLKVRVANDPKNGNMDTQQNE